MTERELEITDSLRIPIREITFTFSRSGGKGGQNVNKVETKVELLFDLRHTNSLTEDERSMAARHLKSRIDGEGILHITGQASRSQWKNREEALTKLATLLREALKPRKKRIRTGIPAAQKQKRLEDKKRRSEIKKWRRG